MRYTSFVLRLWQTEEDRGAAETRFRGQIEHVQSGAVARVRCLEDLTRFVDQHLAVEPAIEDEDASPVREGALTMNGRRNL